MVTAAEVLSAGLLMALGALWILLIVMSGLIRARDTEIRRLTDLILARNSAEFAQLRRDGRPAEPRPAAPRTPQIPDDL